MRLFRDPMWDAYFDRLQGSAGSPPFATTPLNRQRRPAVITFQAMTSPANKMRWANYNGKDFVWERIDGSWIVQDRDPSALKPIVTPEMAQEVAGFVKGSQFLSFASTDPKLDAAYDLEGLREGGAPLQAPPTKAPPTPPLPTQAVEYIFRVLAVGKTVAQIAYWDGSGWVRVT